MTRHEPGASASFSFLTPRGYESYSYNWTQNKTLDDSKRLTLLDHVGGNPVLAAVSRSKYSPQQYDMLVKWLVKGYGYFEQFGLAHMPDEEILSRLDRRRTLEGRADDDPEAVATRLRAYREQTAPVLAFYESRKLVRRVPAIGSVQEIADRVRRTVGK